MGSKDSCMAGMSCGDILGRGRESHAGGVATNVLRGTLLDDQVELCLYDVSDCFSAGVCGVGCSDR